MKKSLFILFFTGCVAGLYLWCAPFSSLAVSHNQQSQIEPSQSQLLQISQSTAAGIQVVPNVDGYFYCLLPQSFVQKMEGFGVSTQNFLDEAGDNLEGPTQKGQSLLLQTTTAMSILNYFHTQSRPLTTGQTYVLLIGHYGSDGKICSTSLENIRIAL